MKELKIINEFYVLLKWYGNLLSKFPRNHRYALGLRIENTLYDILELLSLLDTNESGAQYYFPTGEYDICDMIRTRGLPIGNLTSQLFANFYLSELDHYVREQLHHPYYIRYMDDVIVFGSSRERLKEVRKLIISKLEDIRLSPNEKKDYIRKNTQGIDFLGFRLHQNRIKLRSPTW